MRVPFAALLSLLATTTSFDPAQPGRRVDALGSLEGTTFLSAKEAPRRTGHKLPMQGQPVQGFSGIRTLGNGAFLVLTDNGSGSRANSPDAIAHVPRDPTELRVRPGFGCRTTFLHDPDRKVPFAVVNEGTEKHYLTGADFDIESIQPVGGSLWFGDEFGPYLIEADRSGRVLSVHETFVDGKPARSPDHYAVSTPATPTSGVSFNVRRSRGYEGMAASKDGRFLHPLLEGPLWDADKKDWERVDGKEALRILEFSLAEKRFTGRSWRRAGTTSATST